VDDVALAVTAAEAGAAVVRSRFGTQLTRFDKGDGDFATDVDVEAERIITELLLALRPGDRVIGEEAGESGGADGGTDGGGERRWLVDPLCGTRNFAAGTGPIAVNVALQVGETVTAAAVADPIAGTIDWTDGTAAWRREVGNDRTTSNDRRDTLLTPSAASMLVDVNIDGGHGAPEPCTRALLADPRLVAAGFGPRVVSTSLALAWVASGQRAGYVSDGHFDENVHFAAAIALCRAAGCVVTDSYGEPLAHPGLVAAADEATHAALLDLVSRHRRIR
jgi:myo-inositol-1(or 4)-monophosphatase